MIMLVGDIVDEDLLNKSMSKYKLCRGESMKSWSESIKMFFLNYSSTLKILIEKHSNVI